MHILFALQTAFSIWMLVDAIKKGREFYWWIIVMVPFGELVYFFAFKLDDFRIAQRRNRPLMLPPLKELIYEARNCPSLENQVRLAFGYFRDNDPEAAAAVLEKVLAKDPENQQALFLKARACLALNRLSEAQQLLEKLCGLDLAYADYEAAEALVKLLKTRAAGEKAYEFMRSLAVRSRRLNHQVSLAEMLCSMDRAEEARQLLQEGLEDYDHLSAPFRRMQSEAARRGQKLLSSLTDGRD
jgi:hypothetical protein